jgi:hypothetical protein
MSQRTQFLNFINVSPVGTEMFHVARERERERQEGRQTDRQA